MKYLFISLLILLIIACDDKSTDEPNHNIRRIYLHAYDYSQNFFLLDTSYIKIYEECYKTSTPIIPQFAAPYRIKEIEVWENEKNTIDQPIEAEAVAFADLPPKQISNTSLPYNERFYDPSMKYAPIQTGKIERGKFHRLDDTAYHFDYNLGILNIYNLRQDRTYAVAYRIEGETTAMEDDLFYGTLSTVSAPKDTLILKLIYIGNIIPDFTSLWQRQLKNYYQFDMSGIDMDKIDIKIYYIYQYNDTLEYFEDIPDKLVTILGVDRTNNSTWSEPPDGKFDLRLPYFDKSRGIIMFPTLQPFNNGLRAYFTKINREDLINKYIYPEVYDTTWFDAMQNVEKDKYLIVIESK